MGSWGGWVLVEVTRERKPKSAGMKAALEETRSGAAPLRGQRRRVFEWRDTGVEILRRMAALLRRTVFLFWA